MSGDATGSVLAQVFGLAGFEVLAAADAGGEWEIMIETSGRPVVALAAGGYLDSCLDDVTGVLVADVEPARRSPTASAGCWPRTGDDAERIRVHAKAFQFDRFAEDLERVILDVARGSQRSSTSSLDRDTGGDTASRRIRHNGPRR